MDAVIERLTVTNNFAHSLRHSCDFLLKCSKQRLKQAARMKKVKQRISLYNIFKLLSVSFMKVWKTNLIKFVSTDVNCVEVQDPCGTKRRLLKTQELHAA